MEKQIEIPVDLNACRIHNFVAIYEMQEVKNPAFAGIRERIKVNAAFLGWTEDEMAMITARDNNRIYMQVMKVWNTYKKAAPPDTLEYAGRKFFLIKDFATLPNKWFMDCGAYDLKNEPGRIPAMCYLEKDKDGNMMPYAKQGDTKQILNPSSERMKIFEEHMPLNTFMNISAFFLQTYVEWKGSSIRDEKKKAEILAMQTKLNHLNGKVQSLRAQRNSGKATTK